MIEGITTFAIFLSAKCISHDDRNPDEIAPSCGLLALKREEEDLMISMKSSGQMSRLTCSLIFVLVSSALAGSTAASAQTLTTLTSLTDGEFPWGSLVVDANGALFGTTEQGGAPGYGTVFEIAKTSSGYASAPTTLVSFDNTNGAVP